MIKNIWKEISETSLGIWFIVVAVFGASLILYFFFNLIRFAFNPDIPLFAEWYGLFN